VNIYILIYLLISNIYQHKNKNKKRVFPTEKKK
jgi:hypothetical protein